MGLLSVFGNALFYSKIEARKKKVSFFGSKMILKLSLLMNVIDYQESLKLILLETK